MSGVKTCTLSTHTIIDNDAITLETPPQYLLFALSVIFPNLFPPNDPISNVPYTADFPLPFIASRKTLVAFRRRQARTFHNTALDDSPLPRPVRTSLIFSTQRTASSCSELIDLVYLFLISQIPAAERHHSVGGEMLQHVRAAGVRSTLRILSSGVPGLQRQRATVDGERRERDHLPARL